MPIIEVDHVTKEFRLGQLQSLRRITVNALARVRGKPVERVVAFKALDDVSFAVQEGEVLGIVGHNGAGKSTLLKLLSRITLPSSGRVVVKGKIAPLIEVGAGLVGDMTGRENIYLNGTILGMRQRELRRKFDEIVAFAELERFIDTPLKRYSTGMQVRLGFSVATSVDADILLVDEVLAVGDLAFQRKCFDRMEDLIKHRNRTVLVVGHNIRQLQRLSSRMMLLHQGKMHLDASPELVSRAFYGMTNRKIDEQHAHSGDEVLGSESSGEVIVRSITISGGDGGAATDVVHLHGPMALKIVLDVQVALARPEIIIGFHTSDFVYVASASSYASDTHPDLPRGISVVECQIRDMPLRPGRYSLRLGVLDRFRRALWYGENLREFDVIAGTREQAQIAELGIIDIPVSWTF